MFKKVENPIFIPSVRDIEHFVDSLVSNQYHGNQMLLFIYTLCGAIYYKTQNSPTPYSKFDTGLQTFQFSKCPSVVN